VEFEVIQKSPAVFPRNVVLPVEYVVALCPQEALVMDETLTPPPPPNLVTTKFPQMFARLPVLIDEEMKDLMSALLVREVPEYAATTQLAKRIYSVSLFGNAPEEYTSFGEKRNPEFVCPWMVNPVCVPGIRERTHDEVIILGTANKFTLPPVDTFATTPL